MKRLLALGVFSISILAFKSIYTTFADSIKWPDITPPVADIEPYKRTIHGDTVVDNYYWMIDYFKKGPDSSKVVKYLEAENEYMDTMMSATKGFRERLFSEMKSRI